MTKENDDLNAVRTLVDTLQPFNNDDRDRIIRWAREKLGMSKNPSIIVEEIPTSTTQIKNLTHDINTKSKDIRQFAVEKNPRSDIHFATTVAYFYKFEASVEQRKDEIDKDDLINACRTADRKRPPNSLLTLNNAFKQGLLDRGSERGKFKINSVGENLVAMALPEGSVKVSKPNKINAKRKRKKKSRK